MSGWVFGAGVVLALCATGATVSLLVRRRLVVVSISGLSMTPALCDGDVVLVRRTGPGRSAGHAPRRGDVVVVEEPGPCRPGDGTGVGTRRWVVKRVVALAGDPAPPYLPVWFRGPAGSVPAGHLVLLGDNAEVSRDSRHFGPVRADRVLGVAVRRLGGVRRPGRGPGTGPPS